jgi:hypothetical protein
MPPGFQRYYGLPIRPRQPLDSHAHRGTIILHNRASSSCAKRVGTPLEFSGDDGKPITENPRRSLRQGCLVGGSGHLHPGRRLPIAQSSPHPRRRLGGRRVRDRGRPEGRPSLWITREGRYVRRRHRWRRAHRRLSARPIARWGALTKPRLLRYPSPCKQRTRASAGSTA